MLYDKDVCVIEPENWSGYNVKRLDTVINLKKIKIEMYSNDLTDLQRDSILKKLLPTLCLQYVG